MRFRSLTCASLVLLAVLPSGCGHAPAAAPSASDRPAPFTAHQPGTVGSRSPRPGPSTRPPTGSPAPSATLLPRASGTLHYIANVGDNVAPVAALGYNLFDVGPDPEVLAALPAGGQGLVWVGSLDNEDCASPSYTFAQFTAVVDKLVGNPRVYGYFLADEPHPGVCPTAVADIRQRADYIRAHDPTHRSFIVVLDGTNQCGGGYGCEFRALAPSRTHVDLIGLDPYPCNVETHPCAYRKIDDTVHRVLSYGIPATALVPVFQTFGQACAGSDYYRQPTATELTTMLAHWVALLPHPAFDYTYTWGRQDSSCPTLIDAPDLQVVMRVHNTG